MIRIPGTDSTRPNTQIAIIDGEPELVVNLPMIAELVKGSPLGVDAGFEAVVGHIGPQYRDRLHSMVYGATDEVTR